MPAAEGLAFKAYEIEELVDIHVFRRLGILVARASLFLGLSPNAVSVVSGLVGMTGGALVVDDRWVPLGVTLIVAYGVFDSADGQLARMTGRTSELGRLLDGLGGYLTHTAAYVAILVRILRHGGSWWWVVAALLAGAATAVHAQMYDYHRTTYAAIVLKGRARQPQSLHASGDQPSRLVLAYERLQRRLAGLHPEVERAVAARGDGEHARPEDRESYRATFYRPVRLWNLFGDNVRRAGFVVLAWAHHLEWFFGFILIPLNLLLLAVWLWQQRADRQFLRALSDTPRS